LRKAEKPPVKSRVQKQGIELLNYKSTITQIAVIEVSSKVMKPPLRIAILECDTPLDKIREKYGGYGAIFTALLNAGADALKEPETVSSTKGLEISTWDVVTAKKYPSFENIDAVLITGSSARDNASIT